MTTISVLPKMAMMIPQAIASPLFELLMTIDLIG